ncbi:MAG: glycine cleavage system protein GcvH [Acidaminococcaceae bacterium]|jgi:glycine cleavage system H protein|nr:glycine cleavage system protein GcvH [Acidaminococcaceae bacterium]
MKNPQELKYSKDHEWVKVEGKNAVIGITDYAQSQLGDAVYVELPEVGAELTAGDNMGTIESVKAVSDINSPVTGTVLEVNEALNDAPETVNQEPYGKGWFAKVEITDLASLDDLMDEKAYEAFVAKEAEE